jgi:hypothetical protein
VIDVPDFSDVRAPLEVALSWRADEQSVWAERASVSWGYSTGWAAPATVVSDFDDPPSLTRHVKSSAGTHATQRLHAAGWLRAERT